MTPPLIGLRVVVLGDPVPQGSKKAFARISGGKAFATIVDDNKRGLKAWRTDIANELRQALRKAEPDPVGFRPAFSGEPVGLTAQFSFVKPKSVKREHMTVKPDVDKLVRAVLDALTGLAYKDDSQVVTLAVTKTYRAEGPSRLTLTVWVGPALSQPNVLLTKEPQPHGPTEEA